MDNTIITALIMALSSIICQLLINRNNRQKREKDAAKRDAERAAETARKDANLENRLASIEHKLDTHNGYAEKIGSMAIDIAVIKNEIENLHKEGK